VNPPKWQTEYGFKKAIGADSWLRLLFGLSACLFDGKLQQMGNG
jgi:hypothetical protein